MKLLKIILISTLLVAAINCGKDSGEAPDVQKAQPATEQSAASATASQPPQDPVDKEIILQIDHVEFSNKNFKRFLAAQYSGLTGEDSSPRLLSRIFDSYVEQKIVSHQASQLDTKVSEEELTDYIKKMKLGEGDEKIDREAVKESVLVQNYLYAYVYEKIQVSKAEVVKYYNENSENYRKKAQVELHQILVTDKEAAFRIRGQLKNFPAKFAEKAQEHSISMEAKDGGLMGFFEEGTLPKDMEKVVFSLDPDTISPVVESTYGFHIFKVTQKKNGRLLYLAKVEPEIRTKLMSDKLTAAYENFLTLSKSQLQITINHDALYFQYYPVPGLENEPKQISTK